MVEMDRYATALESSTDTGATRQASAAVNRIALGQASQGFAAQDRMDYARPDYLSRRDQRAILARTVELDVIPRLLQVRPPVLPVAALAAVTETHVAELAALTLGANEAASAAFVAALREEGFAAQALYLNLLTPVARRLGEWWERDVCDFTQVTTGLWRLQAAMRDLSPAFLGSANVAAAPRRARPRILLVPLPGEQHTFGLSMVHEFFSRAGWNAWSGPLDSRGELGATVRRQWVDVVGFSMACDERLETARAEIAAVRLASRNPGLAVLVGGPPFVASPGLAACIGADGTATDGLQAVAAANALLKRQDERC